MPRTSLCTRQACMPCPVSASSVQLVVVLGVRRSPHGKSLSVVSDCFVVAKKTPLN